MTNWEFFMGNGIHQMKVFQVPTPTAQILFEFTMYMASAVQRKKKSPLSCQGPGQQKQLSVRLG